MKNRFLEIVTNLVILLLSTAMVIFTFLYLLTYDNTEMTQKEWLNWVITGEEV